MRANIRLAAVLSFTVLVPTTAGTALAAGGMVEGGGQYQQAVSLTNSVKGYFHKLAERRQAKREFKRYMRTHAGAKKDWKAAKRDRMVGTFRLANVLAASGTALEWLVSIAAPNPLAFTAAGVSTGLVVKTAGYESKLRTEARTVAIGKALAKGDGPSAAQLKRWQEAGIIRHIRR